MGVEKDVDGMIDLSDGEIDLYRVGKRRSR